MSSAIWFESRSGVGHWRVVIREGEQWFDMGTYLQVCDEQAPAARCCVPCIAGVFVKKLRRHTPGRAVTSRSSIASVTATMEMIANSALFSRETSVDRKTIYYPYTRCALQYARRS